MSTPTLFCADNDSYGIFSMDKSKIALYRYGEL